MNDELISELHNLKEKIYITRRSRIIASERCKKKDKCFSFLNTYYAVLMIIISIITITSKSSIQLNIILISLSILVFAFSGISISMQYKERYLSYKANYIKLNELYESACSIDITKIGSDSESEIKAIFKRYNKILEESENHLTEDYYVYLSQDPSMLNKKTDEKAINISDYNKLIRIYKLKKWFIPIFFFVIPFLIPLVIKLMNIWINFVTK